MVAISSVVKSFLRNVESKGTGRRPPGRAVRGRASAFVPSLPAVSAVPQPPVRTASSFFFFSVRKHRGHCTKSFTSSLPTPLPPEKTGFGLPRLPDQLPLGGSPRTSNWKSGGRFSNVVTVTSVEAV